MKVGLVLEKALIVTSNKTSMSFFTEMLNMASISNLTFCSNCLEARTYLAKDEYDYVIVNSPLKDEFGESLARVTATNGFSQVILVVPTEHYNKILASKANMDILVVSKPVNRANFWSALKLAKSVNQKVKRVQDENLKLKKQLQDVAVINRAKCILISYLGMSEEEAHKYIEKQAMDVRQTKRIVAEGILKTYEY
ncbi:MAG: response regulator [Clostridia bacterium]